MSRLQNTVSGDIVVLSNKYESSRNVPGSKQKSKRKIDFSVEGNKEMVEDISKKKRLSNEGCEGLDLVAKEIEGADIKRLIEIEKELILAIESPDKVVHHVNTIDVTDGVSVGYNTPTIKNVKSKEVEELKQLLWDELFGYVPDSENQVANNEQSACAEDSIIVIVEPCTVTSNKPVLCQSPDTVNAEEKETQKARLPIIEEESNFVTPTNNAELLKNKVYKQHEAEPKTYTAAPVSLDKEVSKKGIPTFESYTIEGEEGSGGYGIVYKAKRNQDGATVAIKCPRGNAHGSHVINEIKMLERFGGNNFVIKYEGRLKSKHSDSLVLEFVEHDKPEILKKEINITQLRWYGYCLFKALAGLHKEGVVHRDVKPGNFLFSRKSNKGYLVDFNLAMDLHKKYGANFEPRVVSSENKPKHILPQTLNRTIVNRRAVHERKPESQGTDGSVITSAKDGTSSRTELVREPLPNRRRQALMSLLHSSVQTNNTQTLRKRVAAFSNCFTGREFVYPTPMPLNVNGTTSLGEGRVKKEGPCAGTKGFRAPEVLLRSTHQSTKIDTWSAGVTLLYLITGRAPFHGDPDQNLKDIARLRGSEELWEVAKLHDRESAFPKELYERKFLSGVSIADWYAVNGRRKGFLNKVPVALFDLVDKCLAVNPRVRLTADDALLHEFFAPCRQGL